MSVAADLESSAASADSYRYREFLPLAAISVGVGILALISWFFAAIFNPALYALLPGLAIVLGARSWWTITRAPEDLTGAPVALVGMGLGAIALAAGWGWMAYDYATEVPPGFARISYTELQLTPDGELGPAAIALNGKPVFIKGYVFPDTETQGIRRFMLCRDNGDCCFGGQPPISDMLLVTLEDSQRLTYHRYQLKVYGTFRIAPSKALHDLGGVLYHLDNARFVE